MRLDQIPIGRFSQMTRLTKKALRLYDERGILVPSIKDPFTGYRYYSMKQIETGLKIKSLSYIGFSLSDISYLLKASNNNENEGIKEMFEKKIHEVKEEIERLKKIEKILLEKNDLEDFFIGTTNPSIKELPSIRVISKREIGTCNRTINKLVNELIAQINNKRNQEEHVKITGPVMYICHDRSYKETNADIEIAIPISGRIIVDETYDVKNLTGGKFVYTIYTGNYHDLGIAYTKIFEYATRNGLELNGPSRQLYLSNPKEKEQQELITEVQLPIKSTTHRSR